MLILIKELIQKYYPMKEGELIKDFRNEIFIENNNLRLVLKYKVLKHIIEQRKKDGYSVSKIETLFSDVYRLIELGQYQIVIYEKEINSFILVGKTQEKTEGVMLILEVVYLGKFYFIKTGFYRASSKIKKFLR